MKGEESPHHHPKTTKGWNLAVKWKDGLTSWEKLVDLKESFPVGVAEYAIASNLDKEPDFSWWSKSVIKRCKKTIAAANTKYIKLTQRFGLEIPKTVKQALEVDAENGNQLWQDAIAKEMEAVKVAFKVPDSRKNVSPGY